MSAIDTLLRALDWRGIPSLAVSLVLLLVCGPRPVCASPEFELTICEDLPCLTNLGQPVVGLMAAWNTQHALMVARQMPYFALRNTSSTEAITSLHMTIGDAHYNFDAVRYVGGSNSSLIPALDSSPGHPDAVQGGQRGDDFSIDFGRGLAPGDVVYYQLDIDADGLALGPIPDFRSVLFDANSASGDLDNARIDVLFDGRILQTALFSDYADPNFMTGPAVRIGYRMDRVRPFSIRGGGATVVPEPSTLLLGTAAIAAVAIFGRRRQPARERSSTGCSA